MPIQLYSSTGNFEVALMMSSVCVFTPRTFLYSSVAKSIIFNASLPQPLKASTRSVVQIASINKTTSCAVKTSLFVLSVFPLPTHTLTHTHALRVNIPDWGVRRNKFVTKYVNGCVVCRDGRGAEVCATSRSHTQQQQHHWLPRLPFPWRGALHDNNSYNCNSLGQRNPPRTQQAPAPAQQETGCTRRDVQRSEGRT